MVARVVEGLSGLAPGEPGNGIGWGCSGLRGYAEAEYRSTRFVAAFCFLETCRLMRQLILPDHQMRSRWLDWPTDSGRSISTLWNWLIIRDRGANQRPADTLIVVLVPVAEQEAHGLIPVDPPNRFTQHGGDRDLFQIRRLWVKP
jgi:hypothetical protein